MDNRPKSDAPYVLDEQVGFLMRRANQRHLALFAHHIPELTATQFAALAKLCEVGRASQNALGRATAMDAATIKGVVDRLRGKGFVASTPDPTDQRRVHLSPTETGLAAFRDLTLHAHRITKETLAPLNEPEQRAFLRLLSRLL
ncbi:MarR family winged helix-turn-helix transcriptional regulator [Sedimentitalea nanhaiensis]|uniref:DNA-binding transcriptional regulator, MarR family n=1 Tax=Sedimentitalea nanhaiensis TaxID=999627 RepID=A0A1I7BNQ9_9RHOB|nr:MarR family transcriptional regulator [Sedimentitalea nanhaiensis]SFT88803.1 DNA-binding transcriptional regulator, MarR family [Sedimentitalea nanhaiensis]